MPYFIVTKWSASDDQDGRGLVHRREIIRGLADNVSEFYHRLASEDANDEMVLGPIGLSEDQETRPNGPVGVSQD